MHSDVLTIPSKALTTPHHVFVAIITLIAVSVPYYCPAVISVLYLFEKTLQKPIRHNDPNCAVVDVVVVVVVVAAAA